MNLKNCNGRVPIFVGGNHPYKLVDFPTKEVFFSLYKNRDDLKEKYWQMMRLRAEGHTLNEVGSQFGVTKERIRQIEAKFLRLLASSLKPVRP
jgi:DNA-directed RNA polymerase specialized sigma subunit